MSDFLNKSSYYSIKFRYFQLIHFSIRGGGGTVFKFPENLCDEIRLEFQSRKFLWKSNLNEINIFEAAKKTIKI